MPKWPAFAFGLALLGATSTSLAEPSVDLRGFTPPGDPYGGLYFEPAESGETFDWNLAWFQSYTYRPLVLRDPATGDVANEVISHRVGGNVVTTMAFFERFTLGLDLPFVAYQTGDDPDERTLRVLGDAPLPGNAMGDLRVLGKLTIIPPTGADLGGFAMALHERLGLPTGNEASYLGEGAVTSETRLLLEYRLLALQIHGAAGFRARAEEDSVACEHLVATPEACNTRLGHEIPWGLSLAFRPQALRIDSTGNDRWFIEAFGHVPASPETPFDNAKVSMAQIAAGAKIHFLNDISILAAVDAALVEGIGNAPIRATLSLGWAPRKHDRDGDGVRDEQDKCPEDLQEDHDGFEDDDGCPEWDNDGDDVPDELDQCPDELEDEDGYLDDDGCTDADNDGDGILDEDDACPMEKGVQSDDKARRGCPDPDADRDGVDLPFDKCPDQPEDRDGTLDGDGCPDPDNDGDGIDDTVDACPETPGPSHGDGNPDNGCPDSDGDGLVDRKDSCPDVAGDVQGESPGCPPPGDAEEPDD